MVNSNVSTDSNEGILGIFASKSRVCAKSTKEYKISQKEITAQCALVSMKSVMYSFRI